MAAIIWQNARRIIYYSNSVYGINRSVPRLVGTRQQGVVNVASTKQTAIAEKLPIINDEPFKILESISEKVKNSAIDPTEAANVFNDLNSHTKDMKLIIENNVFKNLCDFVGTHCTSLGTNTLINSLKTVLSMNLPPDLYIVQSLQTEILWRMRKMNYKHLTHVLSFQLGQQRNELECKIVKNCVEMIERRWVEINSLKEVTSALVLKENFSKEFLEKLENRAIEVMENASVDDISKLFAVLSKIKHRSLPMLRSMVFHLAKEKEALNVKQATSVLCAMNSLKFPDHVLLTRLSMDLISEINTIEKASMIGAILTNLGQIRWKNRELMDCLSDWILKNMHKCQPQHLASFVITAANLNYSPYDEKIFDNIIEKLSDKNVVLPEAWLDVVYSLVIKNKAKVIHLVSVLKPEFSKKITSTYGKIKLATIISFAKYEHPNYKHSLTSINDLSMVRTKEITRNNSIVIKALSNFVPVDRFMKKDKMVLNCIPIEAEFVVDSKGKPLALADYSSILDKNEPMPAGVFKLALVVRHFKDYLINSSELTGGNVLSNKLLEKLNYTIIEVPYSDFMTTKTILQSVQYLQNLITKSIADKKV